MLLQIINLSVSMISFAQVWTVQWSDTIPCQNVQFQVRIHLTWFHFNRHNHQNYCPDLCSAGGFECHSKVWRSLPCARDGVWPRYWFFLGFHEGWWSPLSWHMPMVLAQSLHNSIFQFALVFLLSSSSSLPLPLWCNTWSLPGYPLPSIMPHLPRCLLPGLPYPQHFPG